MDNEKAKIERSSFVFYLSFYEAAEDLEPEEQFQLYRAIIRYGLFGEVPTADEYKKHIIAMFKLILPQIDANNKRYLNGKRGGRPSNKPNGNQPETETKPNGNQPKPNVNDNDNVNDNVNDNADGSSASAGIEGTLGCPIPAGMTQKEYEQRIREARA